MSYKLTFKSKVLKEWKKTRRPSKKSISKVKWAKELLQNKAGYRLVYEVRDKALIVAVIVVGKRERNRVYKAAEKRI